MNSQNNRSELFEVLAELCTRYPDWRFGQLVSNIAGWADVEIWDVEDQILLNAARLHIEEIRRRPEALTPAR